MTVLNLEFQIILLIQNFIRPKLRKNKMTIIKMTKKKRGKMLVSEKRMKKKN